MQTKHPTEELPAPLRTIRRSFELLSISYFLNIFASILSIHDFSILKLEADLDGTQPGSYIPSLIPKLLVALTGDRTTNQSNWESRLRREFQRREPHANPLGEEPLKLKPKHPKRAVGYVYIAEPIPLSSIPTLEQLNSQRAQLDQDHLNASHQPTTSHLPPSSIQTPDHPQVLPGSNQTPTLHVEPLSRDSLGPSENQLSSSSSKPILPELRPLQPSDSAPSLKSAIQDQPQNHSESISKNHIPPDSSENSSPAPQQQPPLGAPGTISWSSLSPTVKLKILLKLCEWHFSSPHDLERFRRLVDLKTYSTGGISLDEQYEWRQERCGIDSYGNQYWLAGRGIQSRLWIQRQEPQPPRQAIKLRIPARTSKKRKTVTIKDRKRPYAVQEPTTGSSTPTTDRSRRASNPGPPASKQPRLTGTRSSTRLRATRNPSPPASAPSRPPTMIVIKNSLLNQKPQTPPPAKRATRGSKRPSPKRRGSGAVWQDVPPGWLDEVVQPGSNGNSFPTVFSSDLSEMSDEEEEDLVDAQTDQNKTKISPKPTKSKPTSTARSQSTDSLTPNESLSELTESSDASEVVTCDSASSEQDDPDGSDETEDDNSRPNEGSVDDQKTQENQESLAQASCVDRDVVVKTEHKPTGLEAAEPATEASSGLENQPVSEGEKKATGSSLTDQQADHVGENGQKLDLSKPTSHQNGCGSSLEPSSIPTQNPVPCPSDQQALQIAPSDQTNQLASSKVQSESSLAENPGTVVKSASDQASNSLFPEMKGHPLDPDWIEWEVICSNLSEWKQFTLQFQNSECPSEKHLSEFINKEILQELTAAYEAEELRIQQELQKEIQKEEAAQRKRSSRIASREALAQTGNMFESDPVLRESSRLHSSRLEAKRLKELEMEEARKHKEEDQRLVRLREREERIALREAELASERDAELKRAERARLRAESKLLGQAIKVARVGAENSVPSFDSDQPWRLNCEICGVTGFNMDDGSEVICCDQCEDWQHLICHNKADEIMRRPKRDWTTANFICSSCSGIPIPRAVGKLRTHVNGKPKPKPRTSKVYKPNHYNLNQAAFGSPVAGSSSLNQKAPKLTILMSNPNKLGGTSLSQVYPSSDLAGEYNVSPNFENGDRTGGNRRRPDGPSMGSESPRIDGPTRAGLTPTSAGSQVTPTSALPTVPDLSMYYDDLDGLRTILKTNTHLYRSLPVEVMKRLRDFLMSEQQQKQIQLQQQQQQRQRKEQELVGNSFKKDPSLSGFAVSPMIQTGTVVKHEEPRQDDGSRSQGPPPSSTLGPSTMAISDPIPPPSNAFQSPHLFNSATLSTQPAAPPLPVIDPQLTLSAQSQPP